MEFMAFKLCMDYLFGNDINMGTFISDRHKTIASYMKKNLKKVIHYYDLWHLKKSKWLKMKVYFRFCL